MFLRLFSALFLVLVYGHMNGQTTNASAFIGSWQLSRTLPTQDAAPEAAAAQVAKIHPAESTWLVLGEGNAVELVRAADKRQRGTWRLAGTQLIVSLAGGRGSEAATLIYLVQNVDESNMALEYCVSSLTAFYCYKLEFVEGNPPEKL